VAKNFQEKKRGRGDLFALSWRSCDIFSSASDLARGALSAHFQGSSTTETMHSPQALLFAMNKARGFL
jgi:hypothetical protein